MCSSFTLTQIGVVSFPWFRSDSLYRQGRLGLLCPCAAAFFGSDSYTCYRLYIPLLHFLDRDAGEAFHGYQRETCENRAEDSNS